MCLGFTPRDCLTTHCTVSLLICVSCKCATQYGSCHIIRSISLQLDGFCSPLVGFISGCWWVYSVNVQVIQVGS